MNNNQMNFDPMTGQPINQNVNNTNNSVISNQGQAINVQQTPIAQPVPTVTPVQPTPTIQQVSTIEPMPTIENQQQTPTVNTAINTQQQMQNIATVEQSKQEFINNTQANSTVKQEEKKDGPNIAFIVILFIIIFASIFFLFPYLLEVL